MIFNPLNPSKGTLIDTDVKIDMFATKEIHSSKAQLLSSSAGRLSVKLFMKKRYDWSILIRVVLMFATLTTASFLLVKQLYLYEIIVLPIIFYQLVDFFNYHKKAQDEVEQFVESVHYRDFSRYFDVKHANKVTCILNEEFIFERSFLIVYADGFIDKEWLKQIP